jgi:hypothetical protein
LTAWPAGRLLALSRAIGWGLGLLVVVAFLILLRTGQRMMAAERRESEINANAFIEKVRTCRRQAPGPTPSWNACEQRVRAEL